MQIQQLKTFILIYEEGNFTLAANRLFLTQSAVSQQLSRLEKELGCVLFSRNHHSIMPTPAAIAYYPYAKRIVDLVEEGAELLLSQAKTLFVHFVERDADDPIQVTICELLMKQPDVKIYIRPPVVGDVYNNPFEMEPQHLYLARKSRVHHPAIGFSTLGNAYYSCFLSPADSLGSKQQLTLADLQERVMLFIENFRNSASPWIGELAAYLRLTLGDEHVQFVPNMATIHALLGTSERKYAWLRPGFVSPIIPYQLISCPIAFPEMAPLGLAYVGSPTPLMQDFVEMARYTFAQRSALISDSDNP